MKDISLNNLDERILNCGIFKVNKAGWPEGIYPLTQKKILSKEDSQIQHGIYEVNKDGKKEIQPPKLSRLLKFSKELRTIVERYYLSECTKISGTDFLGSYIIKSEQDGFKEDLFNLLLEYDLTKPVKVYETQDEAEYYIDYDKSILNPHLDKLILKAHKQIKRDIKKQYTPKTKSEEKYGDLIFLLCRKFKKFIDNLNDNDCYHYVAHFLIGIGIEEQNPKRGHRTVYDRIRKYFHRKNPKPSTK